MYLQQKTRSRFCTLGRDLSVGWISMIRMGHRYSTPWLGLS